MTIHFIQHKRFGIDPSQLSVMYRDTPSCHPAVQMQQQLGLRVPVVGLQDCLAPTIAHGLRLCRMLEQPLDGFSESLLFTLFYQETTLRFLHDFTMPGEVRYHNRQASDHVFEKLDRLGVYIIGHRESRHYSYSRAGEQIQ